MSHELSSSFTRRYRLLSPRTFVHLPFISTYFTMDMPSNLSPEAITNTDDYPYNILETSAGPNPAIRNAEEESPRHRTSNMSNSGPRLAKIKRLRSKIIAWILMLPLTAFLNNYIYVVMLLDEPRVGKLDALSASDNNVAISVLSQVFAQIIVTMILSIAETFRWQLASRPSGVSLPMFLQLNDATNWLGSLGLMRIPGKHIIWSILRYDTMIKYVFGSTFLTFLAELSCFPLYPSSWEIS